MIKIEYINYEENIHKTFPKIVKCEVVEHNEIINIDLLCSNIVMDINNDICYDTFGRYLFICIGQWHNNQTGEYISVEEFYDLDENQVMDYEYVEGVIKFYTKEKYEVFYRNYMDRKLKISLIPSEVLDSKKEKILFSLKS